MNTTTIDRAIDVLSDSTQDYFEREDAIRFLAEHPSHRVLDILVRMLQDDNFGVRWEAAASLTRLGQTALPELLAALTDPHRVADSRLREGVYHFLHYNQDSPLPMGDLMKALKGPAAGIPTIGVANHLLSQLKQ